MHMKRLTSQSMEGSLTNTFIELSNAYRFSRNDRMHAIIAPSAWPCTPTGSNTWRICCVRRNGINSGTGIWNVINLSDKYSKTIALKKTYRNGTVKRMSKIDSDSSCGRLIDHNVAQMTIADSQNITSDADGRITARELIPQRIETVWRSA